VQRIVVKLPIARSLHGLKGKCACVYVRQVVMLFAAGNVYSYVGTAADEGMPAIVGESVDSGVMSGLIVIREMPPSAS